MASSHSAERQYMTTDKMLIIAVTTLAGVIAFLFKLLLATNKDRKTEIEAAAKERADWQNERTRLAADQALERQRIVAECELKEVEMRADYEKRHREIIERYDSISRADSTRMLAHEDQVRKEFADIMEKVAAEAGKSSAQLVALLQKLSDRFIGPRGPHY